MSEALKRYVIELARRGVRIDERRFWEYRKPLKLRLGVSKSAEGSAQVQIGQTQVIAGVKLEIGRPFLDTPDEGILIVNAEFAPLASPQFEPGPPGEEATELARVVDRGIRSAGTIDLKQLCLVAGEEVWAVYADIYTLNHDGNLIDASALAVLGALLDAKFPKYEDGKIIYGEKTRKKLPIRCKPIACTFAKIGKYLLLDPCLREEEVMDARLTLTLAEDGNIYAIQKGGIGGLRRGEIQQCIKIASERSKELRKLLG
jgi:exosome complex component RRP42